MLFSHIISTRLDIQCLNTKRLHYQVAKIRELENVSFVETWRVISKFTFLNI